MNVGYIRKVCIKQLSDSGIERPAYVTDLIISNILEINKALLITKYDDELSPDQSEGIFHMTAERVKREPLSYILGEAEFYGRVFKVGAGTLIPRPETELLVEAVLRLAPNAEKFADWCTGSGCLGITALLENTNCTAYGVDSSEIALKWAQINSAAYNLEERFCLICNPEPTTCSIEAHSLDYIIANPPYIPSGEIPFLMDDVKDYEPHEALDGGQDGLDVYRKLISAAPYFLKCGGYFAVETGGDLQSSQLLNIVGDNFSLRDKIYDYDGILRHLIWQIS